MRSATEHDYGRGICRVVNCAGHTASAVSSLGKAFGGQDGVLKWGLRLLSWLIASSVAGGKLVAPPVSLLLDNIVG